MSKERANIFGDEKLELDVGSFTPKVAVDRKAPAAEQVRAVSQAANFVSREPAKSKSEPTAKPLARRYRTGRNMQFNIKADKETVEAFYALNDKQGWVLGFTLKSAVEALQRELTRKK